MSGHTFLCRSRYSSSRSGRILARKQTRSTSFPFPGGGHGPGEGLRARSRPAPFGINVLEVELADVGGVEDEGRAQQDRVVGADREAAELAGGEGLALGAGDLAGREFHGRVAGQVPEVGRVPQLELL